MGNFIDMTGRQYGKLTVIERAEDCTDSYGRKHVQWLCECECGNLCIIKGVYLRNDTTKSCGCYNKERVNEVLKRFNKYDLSGDYGVGYTSNGETFYFDLDDYNLIKDYSWYKTKHGYIETSIYKDKKKHKILLHRLVCQPLSHLQVDHINHDRTDNRKANLRCCSNQENSMNRVLKSTNTSGTTGVYWNKCKQKWVAYLNKNGIHYHLGYFDDKQNAIQARHNAEIAYFQDFAPIETQQLFSNGSNL